MTAPAHRLRPGGGRQPAAGLGLDRGPAGGGVVWLAEVVAAVAACLAIVVTAGRRAYR
jgi:hypothetical protein